MSLFWLRRRKSPERLCDGSPPKGRSPGKRRSLLAALLLAGMAARATAEVPKTLIVLPNAPGSTNITLEVSNYTSTMPTNSGTQVAGTGSLKISVMGVPLPVSANIPFTNLLVNEQTARIVGGAITLANDIPANNLLGSGMDVTLPKGSQITVDAATGTAQFSGGPGNAKISAKLPFRSAAGEQATLLMPTSLTLGTNGDIKLQVTGATLTGPTATKGITLAGFNFSLASLDLKVEHTAAKALAFDVTLKNVTIATPIPNIIVQPGSVQEEAPLKVHADSVGIDENGQPSFGNVQVVREQVEPYRIASTGRIPPPLLELPTIHLWQPLDFSLKVTKINDIKVDHGQFKSFSFTCDMTLPSFVDNGAGKHVEIPDLTVDAVAGKIATGPRTPKALNLNFHGFAIEVTAFGLDLKRGLTNLDARLKLPDCIKSETNQPVYVAVKGFTVGGDGVSGVVTIDNGTSPGRKKLDTIPIHDLSGELAFDRNTLLRASLSCNITLPIPPSNPDIKATVGFTSSGTYSIDIVAGDVPLDALGVKLSLSHGSGKLVNGKLDQLLLTGTLRFPEVPKLQDAVLEFTNLGLKDGKFVGAITLARPVNVNLGVCSVNISKCSYDAGAQSFKLDGGASIDPSLPIKGEIQFYGLTYKKGLPLKIEGMHVRAGVLGFMTIEGEIRERNDLPAFKNPLTGEFAMSLDFLGPGGPGGKIKFLIADGGVWFVGGDVALPNGTIVLPPPGSPSPPVLEIYAFRAGLGHNIQRDPSKSYEDWNGYKPSPNPGAFLIQGGLTLGTLDRFTAWGELLLSVGLNPLNVTLDGAMALLEPYALTHKPFEQMDRYAKATITWNGSTTFHATAIVDMAFPTRSAWFVKAGGSMDALFSPDEGHIYFGWPKDTARPIEIQARIGPNAKGGIGLLLWNKNGDHSFGGYFQEGLDLGIIHGSIGGAFNIAFNDKKGRGLVEVSAFAEGGADFGIASASGRADVSGSCGLPPPPGLSLKAKLEICVHVFGFGGCVDTGEITFI